MARQMSRRPLQWRVHGLLTASPFSPARPISCPVSITTPALRSARPSQSFSSFYDKFHVAGEADPEKQAFLLWLTRYYSEQLERTLGVLGIEVPEYM